MYFEHAAEIWRDFPALVPVVLFVDPIAPGADVTGRTARFLATAQARLAEGPESELPQIRAWRRAFSAMGHKPTQYRCAAESLLRRLRTHGELPQVNPLIDLCNAVSAAYAVPVAVFDVAQITGCLRVRHAAGDEKYQSFSGETEKPGIGEVIFADQADQAHARRWTNRQSGLSAVGPATTTVLIVAEALHESAAPDMAELTRVLTAELAAIWPVTPVSAVLSQVSPRFSF